MDLMRALGMQDEVARISLDTRKFSSSIFCWDELHKSHEGESRNTKDKPWLLHFGASGKCLSSAFYSHKGTRFMDAFMAASTDAVKDVIIQILQNSNVPREH